MPRILLAMFMALGVLLLESTVVCAHFGIVKPSPSVLLSQGKASQVEVLAAFAHPFAQTGMNMPRPREFYAISEGKKIDLLSRLEPVQYLSTNAWQSSFNVVRPGVYQIVLNPEPYYEAAEDCLITHYVKTVIAAFGQEEGWEDPVGLPIEIVPLTRPFANYAGNSFTGQVLKQGKPLADAIVEVEYLNSRGEYAAPNEYFVTQKLRTDTNGYFTFAIPWAGWWGFAALSDGEPTIKGGRSKNTELGGVIWLEFAPPLVK